MRAPSVIEGDERYSDGSPKAVPGVAVKCDHCFGEEDVFGVDGSTLTRAEDADEHICRECLELYDQLHGQMRLQLPRNNSNIFIPD